MKTGTFRHRSGGRSQSGQVMLFTVLGLGIFLIGAMAFAIDLSNMWLSKQSAQTAADAACTAGAMDLLVSTTNGGTNGGFPAVVVNATTGSLPAFYTSTHDCNNSTDAGTTPCQYAVLNGFSSPIASGSTAFGTNVSFDFPTATSNAAPPGVNAPGGGQAPVPYLRVTATNNIPTIFAALLKGLTQQGVRAYSVCGLQADTAPIPILVLHPTFESSFSVQGSPSVNIIGGSTQSIQVNSCSTAGSSSTGCGTNDAANVGGSASVNLCAGGSNFCGSNMGVFGPEAAPGGFVSSCGGNRPSGAPACSSQNTPQWNSPQAPISDPFRNTAAPTNPDASGGVLNSPRLTPFIPGDLCFPDPRPSVGGVDITGTRCTTTSPSINCPGVTGSVVGAACINAANNAGHACTSSDIENGQCFVDYKIHGCPDSSAHTIGSVPDSNNSCTLYTPGYYSAGIEAKNGVSVFDPGLYWLDNGTCPGGGNYAFCLDANSYVRPSFYTGTYYSANPLGTPAYVAATVPKWFSYADTAGHVDGGTLFYFNGIGTVKVDSNSGKVKTTGSGRGTVAPDSFGNNSWQFASATADTLATCPNSGTAPNPSLPNSIGGNILMAPCSISGTWADPGQGTGPFTSPYAKFRGMLFFQDRSNAGTARAPVQANWGGGGQFLLAGTMYFHQCVISSTAADTGNGCSAKTPRPFNVQFTLSGNSSSGTYVLGEIIADQLTLGGSSAINMQLNPNSSFNVLKVALLQ